MMTYAMAYNGVDLSMFPYRFRNMAFNQSKHTFAKCYFINDARKFVGWNKIKVKQNQTK